MRKTIFITGAASGIGRATADLFSRKGWFVGMFDLDGEKLAEASRDIGENNCCYKVTDVGDIDSVHSAVAFFSEKTNYRMDALFNCAGIMRLNSFDEIPHSEHIRTIDVNVTGVLNGIYASLDLLKKTDNSCIISMCSASAFYGVPGLATYSASKFFVKGLTEALNIEFKKFNIRVCDLMPSYVSTPMVEKQKHYNGTLKFLGSSITPNTIANTVYKAAHSKRMRWVPTIKLKILSSLGRIIPKSNKMFMTILSGVNKKNIKV